MSLQSQIKRTVKKVAVELGLANAKKPRKRKSSKPRRHRKSRR